jgi:serine/threonine kinase 38
MDSARGWIQKLQRDKDKGRTGMAGEEGDGDGEVVSSASKQKAEAAKQCIENHYKEQARTMQERKERSVSRLPRSLCARGSRGLVDRPLTQG